MTNFSSEGFKRHPTIGEGKGGNRGDAGTSLKKNLSPVEVSHKNQILGQISTKREARRNKEQKKPEKCYSPSESGGKGNKSGQDKGVLDIYKIANGLNEG